MIRRRSRDGNPVNDMCINILKSIGNGGEDPRTVVVVLVDNNNIFPVILLNKGSNCSCLEGVLGTSTKEVGEVILDGCITCC